MPSIITYTAVLDVRSETAGHLARLLRDHRDRLGTRRGTRVLGVLKQAVLVLRWFVDGTRLAEKTSLIKTECVCGRVFAARAEVNLVLFEYIDGFYNTRRTQKRLG